MMMSIDDQRTGAQALLDIHWSNENIKQEDDTEILHGRRGKISINKCYQ